MERRQKQIVLTTLALALVTVLIGAVVALDTSGDHTTTTYFLAATPSPTTGPAPHASHIPTLVPADYIPPGWRQAGPNFAQTIAFASNDPAVAYSCGALNGKVQVAASTDGGVSWQPAETIAAGATGASCTLTVDPQDARDVAALVQSCSTGQCVTSALTGEALYRSGDAGVNWTQETLPDGNAAFDGLLGWAGGSLFAQVGAVDAGAVGHTLAASAGNGAFTWADNSPLFAQPGLTLTLLAGAGTTLYAGFSNASASGSCLPPAVTALIATDDGGKTWMPVALADGTMPVSIVTIEGGTIVGQVAPAHLVASSDGGKTWQQAPSLPPDMQACAFFIAPDNTFVVQLASVNSSAQVNEIVSAATGATAWTTISSGSVNLDIAAMAVTAQGHPSALWAATQGSLLPFKLAIFDLSPA